MARRALSAPSLQSLFSSIRHPAPNSAFSSTGLNRLPYGGLPSRHRAIAENSALAMEGTDREDRSCLRTFDSKASALPVHKNFRAHEFESRVAALGNVGLPQDRVREFFSRNPETSAYEPQHFVRHIAFFKSIGINGEEFCRILMVYPRVLKFTVEEDLKLAVALLETALGGVLVRSIILWPSILGVMSQENFQNKLNFLLKSGFKKRSKELAKALSCVLMKSTENLEATFNALLSLGLSHNHVCRIVKMQPAIFEQNPREIQRKVDYLLNTLCLSVEDLLKNTSFMIYSLDLRIKPRYKMHTWLKSKGLVRRNFKLDYIMSMSETQFLRKFVESYEDGPRMYSDIKNNIK